MRDIRQTAEYAKHLKQIGWFVETLRGTNYFIKKIPILGKVIKVQRPEILRYSDIKKLSEKHKPFQIVIEPRNSANTSWFKKERYKLSKTPYLPSKTWQIDLTDSVDNLLLNMHQKTRYNIKKSLEKGLIITMSKDIDQFTEFWQKNARHNRPFLFSQAKIIKSLYKAFGKNSDLILASAYDNLVGGVMITTSGKISYYMYAASTPAGKKLFAPTLLVWSGILKAKSRGAKVFDFEGIYDERFPIKSWRGFDRFKMGFGGYEVEYPGTFVKRRLPI